MVQITRSTPNKAHYCDVCCYCIISTAKGHLMVTIILMFVGGAVQSTQQRDVLDKVPEKYDLLPLLAEIKDQWFPIGEMLHVSGANLRGLQSRAIFLTIKRLSATLQYWMDSKSSPVTWCNILDVLRGDFINQPRVADKIQDKLFTELYHKYQ